MHSIQIIRHLNKSISDTLTDLDSTADVHVIASRGVKIGKDFDEVLSNYIDILNLCAPDWAIAGVSSESLPYPKQVDFIDERLIILNAKAGVAFDGQFHSRFYGLDACLSNSGKVYELPLPVIFPAEISYDQYQAELIKKKHQIRPINSPQLKFRKLAVLLQLYYIEQWPEFETYLHNLPDDYDLYVTIPTGMAANEQFAELKARIERFKPTCKIIITENRGMDIGQTFIAMKEVISQNITYDLYLKLHSKGSSDTWRRELIEPICGNVSAVINCMNLLKLPQFGMVGAKKWLIEVVPGDVCTTNNLGLIHGHMERMNWADRSVIGNYFIGGTIFWVKGDIWESLFRNVDIDNTYKHFKEGRVSDLETGTNAHGFERLFGFWVRQFNQKIVGI